MDCIHEYCNTADRINKALCTLKSELLELRSQDVELMKQLLQISETIRELSPKPSPDQYLRHKRHLPYRNGIRSCIGLNAISSNSLTDLPRHRLQSVPSYTSDNGCNSSIEDIDSSTEDCSFGSESEIDTLAHVQMRHKPSHALSRAHSMSLSKIRTSLGKLVEDSCYEEMLKRNIILWKCKMSESSDSVFQEVENETLVE